MLVGYARISTTEQHLDLQRDALTQASCGRLFTDTASGVKAEPPVLAEALHYPRAGDMLAVWKLDWIGRSLRDLMEIVTALEQRGIGFKSLRERMDTTTPGGKLMFHVFADVAEFKRGVSCSRSQAQGSRPRELSRRGVELAVTMLGDPNNRIDDIWATVGISRATLYQYATAVKRATT
jgi:DNA invertase Pin-like site-specific DNA recombinase